MKFYFSDLKIDKWVVAIIFLLFLIVPIVSIIELSLSIIVIFILLFSFSFFCIIFFSKGKNFNVLIRLFVLTLFFNILALLFSTYSFQFNLGSPLGANDEGKFYFEANHIANCWKNRISYSTRMTGTYGYLYTIAPLSFLGNLLGGNNPFNIKLFSTFFGAFIPLIIFYIYKTKFSVRKSEKIAIYTAIFPIMLYFSSIGVRDIIIAFFITLFYYFLIQPRKLINVIVLIIIIIFVSTYRIENVLFLFPMWIIYQFYKKTGHISLMVLLKLGFLMIVISFSIIYFREPIKKMFIEQYKIVKKGHTKMRLSKADESSLGNKIKELPVPFNYIAGSMSGLIGTFPPYANFASPFIKAGNIDGYISVQPKLNFSIGRLMKVIGPFIWYFVLPYIFIGIFYRKKFFQNIKDILFLIYFSILYICLVSSIGFEISKAVPVYPILYSFGICTILSISKKRRQNFNLIIISSVFVLFSLYFFLKYF